MYHVYLVVSAITPFLRYCLVLFVPIYCISPLLESATPFSLVLLLDRFSYQPPISEPSVLRSHCTSNSSKVLLLAHRVSYEVVL